MVMLFMVIAGGIVLTILCYEDYRKNVVKPKAPAKYYIAFVLFALLNIAVYLTICALFLDIMLHQLRTTVLSGSFSGIQYLYPFVIALTYFGVGAGSFKFGTVEFRPYTKLLEIFQNLFPMTDLRLQPPPHRENGKAHCEKLKDKIKEFQVEAKVKKGWDELQDEWLEVKEDSNVLVEQIKELFSISERLNAWPITEQSLKAINKDITKKISTLWHSVNLMLSRFAIHFIFTNIKDRKRMEKELQLIGWSIPVDEKLPPNPASRIIGLGLMSGIVFGLLTAVGLSEEETTKNPLINMWCGAFAFTVFTLFFSTFNRIMNIGRAIIFGLLGGFFGHMIWIILDLAQTNYRGNQSIYTLIDLVYKGIEYQSLLIGALYGGVIAVILFACRSSRVCKSRNKYVVVALCGSGSFVLLYLLFQLVTQEPLSFFDAARSLPMGAVALLGLAYAVNLFQTTRN